MSLSNPYQQWLDYLEHPKGPRPGLPSFQPDAIQALRLVSEPAHLAAASGEHVWGTNYQLWHGGMIYRHVTPNGKTY